MYFWSLMKVDRIYLVINLVLSLFDKWYKKVGKYKKQAKPTNRILLRWIAYWIAYCPCYSLLPIVMPVCTGLCFRLNLGSICSRRLQPFSAQTSGCLVEMTQGRNDTIAEWHSGGMTQWHNRQPNRQSYRQLDSQLIGNMLLHIIGNR